MFGIDIDKYPTRTSNAVVYAVLLAALGLGLAGRNLGWWGQESAIGPDGFALSVPTSGRPPLGEQIATVDAIRTLRYADREIDAAWKRVLIRRAAPALEAWIRETRDRIRPAAEPIPVAMRNRLAVHYKGHEFVGVKYIVDANLIEEIRRASYDLGSEETAALVDVIVFRDSNAAASDVAWARALALCRRFEQWGVERFARRYLENWKWIVAESERDAVRYARLRIGFDEPVIGQASSQE